MEDWRLFRMGVLGSHLSRSCVGSNIKVLLNSDSSRSKFDLYQIREDQRIQLADTCNANKQSERFEMHLLIESKARNRAQDCPDGSIRFGCFALRVDGCPWSVCRESIGRHHYRIQPIRVRSCVHLVR